MATIEGDLFVDCSGSRALCSLATTLAFLCCQKTLFYLITPHWQRRSPTTRDSDPIESCTLSTAQSAGWIWDIGLPTRRGIGHVYSSDHNTEERASEELLSYIASTVSKQAAAAATMRKVQFSPGHRAKFWHKNCVAIGMSAGFIEPLEASALVLVELSAAMIAEQLPANRGVMDLVAKRFNDKFLYRWDRIIEFLKLHYILSQRREQSTGATTVKPRAYPSSLQIYSLCGATRAPGIGTPITRRNVSLGELSICSLRMDFRDHAEPDPAAFRAGRQQQSQASLFQENAVAHSAAAKLPANQPRLDQQNSYLRVSKNITTEA